MKNLLKIFGVVAPRFEEGFNAAAWLEKHGGDATTALNALENTRLAERERLQGENFQAREAKRKEAEAKAELQTQLETYQKRLPEGALVLSPEDAKVYQALLDGKTLTERKTQIEELAGKVQAAEVATAKLRFRDMADIVGLKPTLFELLARDLNLEVDEKEGVKSVNVRTGEKTLVPWADYAKENFGDVLPAGAATNQQAKKADGSGQKGSGGDGGKSGLGELVKQAANSTYSRPSFAKE